MQIDCVQQLAVDIELQLLVGTVADPHGLRAAIALEVVERLLRKISPAIDAVNGLKRAGAASVGLMPAIFEPVS